MIKVMGILGWIASSEKWISAILGPIITLLVLYLFFLGKERLTRLEKKLYVLLALVILIHIIVTIIFWIYK